MPDHGHTTYFRTASVEYYDPAKRPSGWPSGYRVEGSASDLRIVWGFYADEVAAHAAARTLDQLLGEYERLGVIAWNEARARYWRWAEAESLAGRDDGARQYGARQYGWAAERHERQAVEARRRLDTALTDAAVAREIGGAP